MRRQPGLGGGREAGSRAARADLQSDRPGGVRAEERPVPDVLPRDGDARVAGLAHAGQLGRALHHERDGAIGQAGVEDPAMPRHRVKDRPRGDAGAVEPGAEPAHRAGLRMPAVRHPNLGAFAFLIGLRAPDGHDLGRQGMIPDREWAFLARAACRLGSRDTWQGGASLHMLARSLLSAPPHEPGREGRPMFPVLHSASVAVVIVALLKLLGLH